MRDFEVAKYFSQDHNFEQGVKCLLIEKGSTPKWSHKHLLDVSEEDVDKVFKEEEKNRLNV